MGSESGCLGRPCILGRVRRRHVCGGRRQPAGARQTSDGGRLRLFQTQRLSRPELDLQASGQCQLGFEFAQAALSCGPPRIRPAAPTTAGL